MLELKHIESFYPENLRHFKRNILREYLQYKILAVIFGGKYAGKLVFMGGTAIHIAHGMPRFSEDLDFDNLGLSQEDFRQLAHSVVRQLSLEGFSADAAFSFKEAYSADIKITGILFELGLSGHRQEKVLVKIDAQAQGSKYSPQRIVINKFDVACGISVVPADILLAQKFYAILKRRRAMGRDFYDAMFLAGKARPDFAYLKAKAGIDGLGELKRAMAQRCKGLNFKQLARDTEALVYVAQDAKKIGLFPEFIEGLGE